MFTKPAILLVSFFYGTCYTDVMFFHLSYLLSKEDNKVRRHLAAYAHIVGICDTYAHIVAL